MIKRRYSNIYLAVLTLSGWFALVAQFCINIRSNAAPLPEIVVRYFSYFTLLTNLIVAVCSTVLVIKPHSKWGRFFSGEKIFAAITVYIVIVGIIYNVILRFIWNPQGLQMIVDELLHSVIPVLFLLYWLLFVAKNSLQWKDVLSWLIYPLAYCIYIFIRGAISGFYPYPFINVTQLGLPKALINSFFITLVFVAVSMLFIGIGKIGGNRK